MCHIPDSTWSEILIDGVCVCLQVDRHIRTLYKDSEVEAVDQCRATVSHADVLVAMVTVADWVQTEGDIVTSVVSADL